MPEVKLTVNGKSIDLTIDQLKSLGLYNEKDIEKEKEQFFLDQLNGSTIHLMASPIDGGTSVDIHYKKNGVLWAKWSEKNKYFHIDCDSVWLPFKEKFYKNINNEIANKFLIRMVLRHLKYMPVAIVVTRPKRFII